MIKSSNTLFWGRGILIWISHRGMKDQLKTRIRALQVPALAQNAVKNEDGRKSCCICVKLLELKNLVVCCSLIVWSFQPFSSTFDHYPTISHHFFSQSQLPQTIYDDANDKLELSQSLSKKSKVAWVAAMEQRNDGVLQCCSRGQWYCIEYSIQRNHSFCFLPFFQIVRSRFPLFGQDNCSELEDQVSKLERNLRTWRER